MAACSTSLGFTDDCMLVNVKPRVLRRSFSNASTSTSFSIIHSTLTTGQIDDDARLSRINTGHFGERRPPFSASPSVRVVPDAVIRMSLFTQKQMRRAVISLPMKSSALPAPLLPSRKILDGINRTAGNFADICTDSRNVAQQEEGGKA